MCSIPAGTTPCSSTPSSPGAWMGCMPTRTTSNVDIFHEKKLHGDKVTIIGGVGVDYLLTDRSRDEEVVDRGQEAHQRSWARAAGSSSHRSTA